MINKLKALLDASTPGRWNTVKTEFGHMTVGELDLNVPSIPNNDADVRLIVAMRNCIDEMVAVVDAANACNRLLADWDLIRQHSYVHEKLNRALAALASKMGEGE